MRRIVVATAVALLLFIFAGVMLVSGIVVFTEFWTAVSSGMVISGLGVLAWGVTPSLNRSLESGKQRQTTASQATEVTQPSPAEQVARPTMSVSGAVHLWEMRGGFIEMLRSFVEREDSAILRARDGLLRDLVLFQRELRNFKATGGASNRSKQKLQKMQSYLEQAHTQTRLLRAAGFGYYNSISIRNLKHLRQIPFNARLETIGYLFDPMEQMLTFKGAPSKLSEECDLLDLEIDRWKRGLLKDCRG